MVFICPLDSSWTRFLTWCLFVPIQFLTRYLTWCLFVLIQFLKVLLNTKSAVRPDAVSERVIKHEIRSSSWRSFWTCYLTRYLFVLRWPCAAGIQDSSPRVLHHHPPTPPPWPSTPRLLFRLLLLPKHRHSSNFPFCFHTEPQEKIDGNQNVCPGDIRSGKCGVLSSGWA